MEVRLRIQKFLRALSHILLVVLVPACAAAAPEGTFLLQGLGSATVDFSNGSGDGNCAANVTDTTAGVQINDMSMDIGPLDSGNESPIAFSWPGPTPTPMVQPVVILSTILQPTILHSPDS